MTVNGRSHETACLVITDVHYGKSTATFNPEICRARMQSLGERIIQLRAQMATSVIFDRLCVFILGDINDGSDIYATQSHHQAISNVEEQARECAAMLEEFLIAQKAVWGDIRVFCVAGNHGRAGKMMHEAASWDIVTYRYLKLSIEPKGVPVDIDDKHPFLRVVKVRGHGILLYHGHEIKSFGNIPWYGMMLRLMRWRSASSVPPWKLALMGHVHSLGHWHLNSIQLMLSGTMISDDSWALQCFGWESATSWWLFGVSDNHIPTWQFAVELDDSHYRATPVEVESVSVPVSDMPSRPRVHGKDIIMQTVQDGTRIVSAPTPRAQVEPKIKVPYGTCQVCKKEFKPAWNTQKVCETCRTIKCAGCGTEFKLERYSGRKYCTEECYHEHRRNRFK